MGIESIIKCEDLIFDYSGGQSKSGGSKQGVDQGGLKQGVDQSGLKQGVDQSGLKLADDQGSSKRGVDQSELKQNVDPSSTNRSGGQGTPDKKSQGNNRNAIRALNGVSFDVKKGEFIAIVGRNGSGKTTLAKCLNALFTPSEGHVFINGWDTRDEQHIWNIRQTAGMVFQNPDNQLVSSIVEDDVAFGPENLGLPPELIRKRVDEALEAVGMSDAARRAPHMLSGGQKQRIAIAGVIAMRPKCIVFDEPTAMLDPKGRKEIMSIMEKLHKEGITIVLITHFMDEAIRADKIILMDNGKIVRQGTAAEIFTDRKVMELFKADLPCGVELALKLRESGLDVPEDIITEEQLADYLVSVHQSRCDEAIGR